MTNKKKIRFQGRKDTIKCKCGTEILILPDVKATSEAIEGHIALHLEGVKGPMCQTADVERLRDSLIIQALRIAAESEDKKTNE
jgi:hypothetical protein